MLNLGDIVQFSAKRSSEDQKYKDLYQVTISKFLFNDHDLVIKIPNVYGVLYQHMAGVHLDFRNY